MALQYSTISVEPAPGYGVHNPGPTSTDGFAMRPGAKVFAPEAQLDFHLDVAAQSPAITSVSVVTHRSDFFPKGSVVTIVQIRDYDKALTPNAQQKITSRGGRRTKECTYMVALTKPDETIKGKYPYKDVLGTAAVKFLDEPRSTINDAIVLNDSKPLGVLAEAVKITAYTPTVIAVAVMGAIEAACDQNVEKWHNMFPGERVMLRVSGVSRAFTGAAPNAQGLLPLSNELPGEEIRLQERNEQAGIGFSQITNDANSSVMGYRPNPVFHQSVACRVITPPDRATGLVYVYLE